MINEIQLYHYLKRTVTPTDRLQMVQIYHHILGFDGYLLRTQVGLDYYRPFLHNIKEANHSGDVPTFAKGLDALVEAIAKKNNGTLK